MVYSLGIPKQTETAKAKHSILAYVKEKCVQSILFLSKVPYLKL